MWETDLHYRFVLDDSKTELEVWLEKDDGEVLSTSSWAKGTLAVNFYQTLVEVVRAAGRDLGTMLNAPTQSVEELSSVLVGVTQLRAQEFAGHRSTHLQIIERNFGWYFTRDSLVGGPITTTGLMLIDSNSWIGKKTCSKRAGTKERRRFHSRENCTVYRPEKHQQQIRNSGIGEKQAPGLRAPHIRTSDGLSTSKALAREQSNCLLTIDCVQLWRSHYL